MNFKILIKTPLWDAFSDLGRRIFLPEGIFYWSGRAKKEAELNATIGSAYGYERDFIEGGTEEWLPCYLDAIKPYSNLKIDSLVPYASIGGVQAIREIWKKWIIKKSLYDILNEKDKLGLLEKYTTTPIVTQGVTNGIFLCCSLFLSPSEYIISPNKRWGNYDNIINKFLGANIKSFEFFVNQEINLQGMKDVILDVAKYQEKIIIILNFPNNPTGYTPKRAEIEKIVNTLKESQKQIKKPIIVLVDDAYEPYVYNEGEISRSLFYDLIEVQEDVIPIKLDGITKELLIYGGRVGFATFGLKPAWVNNDEELEVLKEELNNKLEGITRSTISNTNHFYQALTVQIFQDKGMDDIVKERDKVRRLLKSRYKKINEELSSLELPDISIDPNSGGFFLFINLNPNKIKASEFADHLLKKYKIGVIPIEKLNDNINGIRIAYASIDLEKISEFVTRIRQALKDF
ncbi:MAG: aminotransferase class I/II-fold pyridoxal phosphate-dependent enzyme [Candidatus Lokiarchaeota archaeon]|nr:aminotransferase class I/II-fold pyridoxal phosphate-dependent enzyme [Candidatus Lokiarchaeota archaeon]